MESLTEEMPVIDVTYVSPDHDEPELPFVTSTVTASTSEYQCEVCQTPLTYGGRGRKPTRCAEHKKSGSRAPSTPRAGTTSGRWQQPLSDALLSQFAMIGVAVYAFDNFDGQAILNGSPALAQSLVGAAEHNPKVRRALETFVTAGAWAGVASAVLAIAIPILQNHNVIPAIPFPMPKAA